MEQPTGSRWVCVWQAPQGLPTMNSAASAKPFSRPTKPLVSIVIPAYNAEDTLGDQLEALSSQVVDFPWEIVLVNNNSRDRTVEVAEGFRDRLPLRVVNAARKQAPSYARNEGVRQSHGKLLLFCDADDVVSERWLSLMAAALKEHDFVGGSYELTKLNPAEDQAYRAMPVPGEPFSGFLPFTPSGCMGIRREIHERIGGFDERYRAAEDIDYSWRVQLNGHELHFVPEAVVHYRLRSRGADVFRQICGYDEGFVQLAKKYGPMGMVLPSSGPRKVARQWWQLLRRMPSELASRSGRQAWLWGLGGAIGRLRGSIRYRKLVM
jgi:glycosyltransferase involved in cell wall biosynthesis